MKVYVSFDNSNTIASLKVLFMNPSINPTSIGREELGDTGAWQRAQRSGGSPLRAPPVGHAHACGAIGGAAGPRGGAPPRRRAGRLGGGPLPLLCAPGWGGGRPRAGPARGQSAREGAKRMAGARRERGGAPPFHAPARRSGNHQSPLPVRWLPAPPPAPAATRPRSGPIRRPTPRPPAAPNARARPPWRPRRPWPSPVHAAAACWPRRRAARPHIAPGPTHPGKLERHPRHPRVTRSPAQACAPPTQCAVDCFRPKPLGARVEGRALHGARASLGAGCVGI
jgi:hypothetical protein